MYMYMLPRDTIAITNIHIHVLLQLLEHTQTYLPLHLLLTRAQAEGYSNHSVCLQFCYRAFLMDTAFFLWVNAAMGSAFTLIPQLTILFLMVDHSIIIIIIIIIIHLHMYMYMYKYQLSICNVTILLLLSCNKCY